jgi:diaminopimelate epimerase
MPDTLHLTKHHGLGNDFLVLLDQGGDGDLAVRLCDRRFGLGADGLLLGMPGDEDHDLVMRLHNADGSVAEMSGNGIRCLAQAAVMAGWAETGKIYVATDAGLRIVDLHHTEDPTVDVASVNMGAATIVELDPPWAEGLGKRAAIVDVGNPHLVLHADPEGIDLEALYESVIGHFPAGVNLEVADVSPSAVGTGDDTATMRVRERGVGETLACGTGTCAVTRAFHEFGLCGTSLWVTQPGGTARVALRGDQATLIGSTTYVGSVEVPA